MTIDGDSGAKSTELSRQAHDNVDTRDWTRPLEIYAKIDLFVRCSENEEKFPFVLLCFEGKCLFFCKIVCVTSVRCALCCNGGSFSGTVKPIVTLPVVICCGRLVVVSSIPPGDFFFLFLANLLFFGAQRPVARGFGAFEIGFDGCPLPGPGGAPQPQKPRSWRGKPPVLRVQFGHSGAFFFGVRADASRRT